MYVIWATDNEQIGPDGQTQDFAVAYYTRHSDAVSVAKGLSIRFENLDFDVRESEAPLVDAAFQDVVKSLET